ncbi:TrlF family AAA-like ATPase [Arenibacter algicola]|uniref:AAA domain, putative AbiEii toxin, type IV TA system n=1 Tax=Arenibacter algicola TaxID=616991 RepID=A0A221US47_9FLAO|nr:AAA family ATPase [Arenibacter algicola]ASO04073.1 AAA domain, putative AbiEii toxin, type IV TA system [Arenibacter algicola]
MDKEFKIFENGSTWLRADFHLHTKADKEFVYRGEDNSFVSDYVNKLSEEKIGVAAITNHNKFDFNEYKALAKKSRKQEIYLLPGVELSVNDGANGIHCLVIFNPIEWLENGTDYINSFINQTFAGKHNYENENGRSNDSLIETIKKLDAFEKDYFIIMAHIEANSGFYKELNGGRITELGKVPIFRKAVLGFQKVRTRDIIKNLNTWLENELPAFVECSDAKNIEEIGTGNTVNGVTQKTYLKIGAFNFEAIKYALLDQQYRLAQNTTDPINGYIKSISFKGGKLDGSTLHLNHSMNNLIGIRGSGKSSILEAIRYSLDIDLTEKQNVDYDYKTKLVNALLGSGGKITSVLVDDQGKEYVAEKILGDRTNIYKDGELQLGLKPNAIVKKPIYFGQKDLSQIGDSLSTEYLISKLIGDRLLNKKREVEEKNQDVLKIINELKKIDSKVARKADIEAKQAELKIKIQVFKDNEIDKKLEKQISFDKDSNFIKRLEKFELKVIEGINEYVGEYEDSFQSFKAYSSKENTTDIDKIKQHLIAFEGIFLETKTISSRLVTENLALETMHKSFNVKYEELKEEFSKIKREINLPNIQADDYVKYTKELDLTKAQLSELEKLSKKKKELETQLKQTLVSLQKLWHNEFEIVQEEIKKVNDDQDSIKIAVEFKGNKQDFKSYLKENLRGSNLRDNNIQTIIDSYSDMIAVYEDLNLPKSNISTNLSDVQLHTFREYFNSNIEAFLTYRIPDKFDIIYRNRSLNEHSLGQRASALIIFLLTLKESDLIIIDQPEDDLDNQTIYNDVIKVLKELKNTSQFIFATHNPNIPVLGDCEQVVSCRYDSNIIETNLGSIDDESIRKEIVNIMEGGKEAFNNRKRIYELWTH